VTHLNFEGPDHISGMAEGTVVRFCAQVGYIKSQPWDDKQTPNGCGLDHMTHFKFWGPIISLGWNS